MRGTIGNERHVVGPCTRCSKGVSIIAIFIVLALVGCNNASHLLALKCEVRRRKQEEKDDGESESEDPHFEKARGLVS